MSRKSFRDIWNEHDGLYSVKREAYLDIYDQWLAPFIDQPVTLVEFGVLRGGSLQLWRKFLGDKARIIGVDIVGNADWEKLGDGIETIIGAQQDVSVLSSLPQADIVIDDADHMPDQQIVAFSHMWNKIKPGGIYVIEDLIGRSAKTVLHVMEACILRWPVHVHREILIAHKSEEPQKEISVGMP